MRILLTLGVIGLAYSLNASAPVGDKCDLKKVEDGYWCDACGKVLESGDLVEKEFCKKCNDGKKGKDRAKAKKVQVCVKHYFQCEADSDEHAFKAGKCKKCKKEMKEMTDKCVVVFVCEGCKKEGDKEGPCPEKDCKKAGKKFVKSCKKSGEFPHVPEK